MEGQRLVEWRKEELRTSWKPSEEQMCLSAVLRELGAESTVYLCRKIYGDLDWKEVKGREVSSQRRSPECTARTVSKREVWWQEDCEIH